PERLVPLHVAIAAEDVVDEDVEPGVLPLDPRDELADRRRILVVDHERRAVAARGGQQLPGLLDRLGPADLRRPGSPATAAGGVDEEPCARELDGDRATGAAGGAGDERDRHLLVHIASAIRSAAARSSSSGT